MTRKLARIGLMAIAAVGFLFLLGGSASAATFAAAENGFSDKVNAERVGAGLQPLAVDVQLVRVARGWTAQMAAADAMTHNPDLGAQVQGDWSRLGENVGWSMATGAEQDELVDRLHVAFMESPGHRANVLGEYNRIGVGVQVTEAGKMWVTLNFSLNPTSGAVGQLDESVRLSQAVFVGSGEPMPAASQFASRAAGYAVIGRADVFADALGGAGLAGDQAPMLFTPGPSATDGDPLLHPAVRAEIDRVLGGTGTVYLLGGTSAVSGRVESELAADGYDARRLAGASRVETSVRVAQEVVARHGDTGEVLIARADDWADAVTGGAYAAYHGSPVVLTTRDGLHPAVAEFLAQAKPQARWALGGPAALTEDVVVASGATRISGADRTATAVAIASQLWGRTAGAQGDNFVTIPGYAADGWAYALAHAPWSAANAAPQLLVNDTVSPSTQAYLSSLGYGGDVVADAQSASVISGSVVDQVQALLGS